MLIKEMGIQALWHGEWRGRSYVAVVNHEDEDLIDYYRRFNWTYLKWLNYHMVT